MTIYYIILPKDPTLSTLTEILIDDSSINDDQVDRHKQWGPEKDSIASFRTVHSSISPVGHSRKFQGYITTKLTYK